MMETMIAGQSEVNLKLVFPEGGWKRINGVFFVRYWMSNTASTEQRPLVVGAKFSIYAMVQDCVFYAFNLVTIHFSCLLKMTFLFLYYGVYF